ncbi:MAG: hypothetical protein EOO87_17650 [Pedobacter sp.]|nr:MAG: hypothetical protein EOO87_17650 [Pedobacter sp.]
MRNLLVKSVLSLLLFVAFSSKAAPVYNDGQEALYKHLGSYIKYPNKATFDKLQGNSLILFSVADGKISDIKIDTELGGDCDGEVVNRLLSFKGYADVKPGKYALKTTFSLSGATTVKKNEAVNIPEGHQELKLTIVGFAGNDVGVTGYGQKSKSGGDIMGIAIKPIDVNAPKGGLVLRGGGTWDADKAPLIILDGKHIDKNTLDGINPNTIESMTVLKDASSTALYGKEGVNGVIIIASKLKSGESNDIFGVSIKPLNGTEPTGLTIRGSGNWDKEKAPLIILNGETIDNDTLKQLDPNTIESVSVIKDASSTAQYGTSGANGVVIVTTKVKEDKKPKN